MKWLLLFLMTFGCLEGSVEPVLCRLAERARESNSESVLIMHGNRPIFQYHASSCWQPLDSWSITKSVVALAIGIILDEGKLESVDTPLYRFYPEWDQGNKRLITIRHLLAHTSGLQTDGTVEEVYRFRDSIQFALAAELSTQPGCIYNWNHKAFNLLAGIVKKATGTNLHEYLMTHLFTPLGIENVSWLSDGCGNHYAMAHMIISAPDLAKIGMLIQNGGFWCGRSIVSKHWIDLLSCPCQCFDPFYGLSWWIDYHDVECYWDDELLNRYQCAGVNPHYIARLRSLQGRVLHVNSHMTMPEGCNFFSEELVCLFGARACVDSFYQEVKSLHLPFAKWRVGCVKSFSAKGYQGQQLIILPDKNLVGVRQSKRDSGCDTFQDFGALLEELAYRMVDP